MTNERKAVVQHSLVEGNIVFEVLGAGSFAFDPSKCNEDTEASALVHGYVQKISDKAAIQRDPKTGRSATPQEKFARMKELAEHLMGGGSWTMRSAAKALLNRAALFAAVATVRKVDAALIAQRWQAKSDEELRSVLQHADIAAEYSRLTTPADSSAADAMLATLE